MEEVGRNKHHHHHHRASVASIAAAAGIMPATTASTPSDEDESASSVVSKVIGTVGRWQVEKACLLGLSSVPLAWHFMAYPLLSQEKEFWCLDDGAFGIDGEQCQIPAGPASNSSTLSDENANDDDPILCSHWEFESGGVSLQEDFQLVCQYEGLLSLRQILFFLGMVLGCLTSGRASDSLGRKTTMLGLMFFWSFSAIFHVFIQDYKVFLALQFLLAFCSNSAWTTGWIWVMEVIGGKWRTIIGLSFFLWWAIGYVGVAGIVILFPDWRDAWLTMSLPTVLFALYYFVIPESPMWLICHGREAEAKAILDKASVRNGLTPISAHHWSKILEATGHSNAIMNAVPTIKEVSRDDDAASDVTYSSSASSSGGGGYLSLIKTPNVRKKTLILFTSWFVSALTYYGLSLNSGDIGNNPIVTFTFYGLIEIPAILVSICSIVTAGRRLTLILLTFGAGASCLGAALIPQGRYPGDWPSVLLAVSGKFCITCCFHVLYVFTSEIYATSARNTGLACCSLFARIGGMVAPFVARLKTIHPFMPIAVFGACTIVSAILSGFMPETKGARLPQSVEESEDFGLGDSLWEDMRRRSSKRRNNGTEKARDGGEKEEEVPPIT